MHNTLRRTLEAGAVVLTVGLAAGALALGLEAAGGGDDTPVRPDPCATAQDPNLCHMIKGFEWVVSSPSPLPSPTQ